MGGQRYHKIGEFWTHFPDDLEDLIEILNNAGYSVCETMSGDMAIMKEDTYTEIDEDMFNNDNDEDDDGWTINDGGYNPTQI